MHDYLKMALRISLIPLLEIGEYITYFLFLFPGKFGGLLRYLWAKLFLKSCGVRVGIACGVKVKGANNITIMNKVKFDENCYLDARGGNIFIGNETMFNRCVYINASIGGKITFGDDCIIGPNVIFRTANHNYMQTEIPIKEQGHETKNISVCDDVWVGAAAIILPGVTLGKGSVVAAGSVVTKTVPEYQVVAGNPARFIKKRS